MLNALKVYLRWEADRDSEQITASKIRNEWTSKDEDEKSETW